LIFFLHGWKFFPKWNVGCSPHSKRRKISLMTENRATLRAVTLNHRCGQQGWLLRHSKFLNTNNQTCEVPCQIRLVVYPAKTPLLGLNVLHFSLSAYSMINIILELVRFQWINISLLHQKKQLFATVMFWLLDCFQAPKMIHLSLFKLSLQTIFFFLFLFKILSCCLSSAW
jgi:hypothetical protein